VLLGTLLLCGAPPARAGEYQLLATSVSTGSVTRTGQIQPQPRSSPNINETAWGSASGAQTVAFEYKETFHFQWVTDGGVPINEDPPEADLFVVEGSITASAVSNASPSPGTAKAQLKVVGTGTSGGAPTEVAAQADFTQSTSTIPPPPGTTDTEPLLMEIALDGPAPSVEITYEGSAQSDSFGVVGQIQVQRDAAVRIQRIKIVAPTNPITTARTNQVTDWDVEWETNVAGIAGAQPDGTHKYRIRIEARDNSGHTFGGSLLTNSMASTQTLPLQVLISGTYTVTAFLDISDGSQWHTKAGSKQPRALVVQ
jgi:hypothetical protein